MMGDAERVFEHLSPGRMIVGPGCLDRLPGEAAGSAPLLVVTDPGLAKAGLAGRVMDRLADQGVAAHLFDGVHADPPTDDVEAAVELAKAKGCRGIIGLGGGSSIDTAKAVGARLAEPDTPWREFNAGKWVNGPMPDLYAVPTTAGTGSEATRVAVITDPDTHVKMAIRGVELAPKIGFLDPLLLASLPPKIAAETGADALTHAVEAYVSRRANPITDGLALAAIRLIGRELPRLTADPANTEAAERMLVGSCLAGQAFSNAGLGLAHSMAEPLGAFCHVSHGLACAIYLPVIMEFNLPAAETRFADIAVALGRDISGLSPKKSARAALAAVLDLFNTLAIPLTYQAAGIDFSLDRQMVTDVPPQFSSRCNPREASEAEVEALYLVPAGKGVSAG